MTNGFSGKLRSRCGNNGFHLKLQATPAQQKPLFEPKSHITASQKAAEEIGFYPMSTTFSVQELDTVLEQLNIQEQTSPDVDRFEGCDFSAQNNDGDTLLMTAIIHQRQDIALAILRSLPDYTSLSIRNTNGQTALHLAVAVNDAVLARKIVTCGANLEVYDRVGYTPLHLACKYGYKSVVLALTTVIDYSDVRGVSYEVPFRRIPQNQELRSYSGHTFLQLAITGGHIGIAHHLITKCFSDVNVLDWTSGESLVHWCIQTRSLDVLKFLNSFRRQLDLNKPRYDCLTPLDLAYSLQYWDAISYLSEFLPQKEINLARMRAQQFSTETESHMYSSISQYDTSYDDIRISGQLLE